MRHGLLSFVTIILLSANMTPAVLYAQPQPQLPLRQPYRRWKYRSRSGRRRSGSGACAGFAPRGAGRFMQQQERRDVPPSLVPDGRHDRQSRSC